MIAAEEAFDPIKPGETITPSEWIQRASQWVQWDPNSETKEFVQNLITQNDIPNIKKILSKRIEFGTAGLRGSMGAGSNAINDLTIIQTTQGLCKYLVEKFGDQAARTKGIAVGYDHRKQNSLSSKRFAELVAVVAIVFGIKVYFLPKFVPTPFVAFLVQLKKCAAGVMITASHNPKQDNGYKLYSENGCQLISPEDEYVRNCIWRNLAPWKSYSNELVSSLLNRNKSELFEDVLQETISQYFSALRYMCRYPKDNAESDLRIVYTPMHGVGDAYVRQAFERYQIKPYTCVEMQRDPDAEFPTVAFPNPEEGKGTLQLAIETARDFNATLILANDPDADRLAVAERDLESIEWRLFNGNEIGAILGHYALQQHLIRYPDADRSKLYFIASTVSSKMLRAIAKKEGVQFAETLSGFKWIGNKAHELISQGNTVLFSFEEAIGFCIGDLIKDKDGISAAVAFAEMCIQLRKQQKTIAQHLQELYDKYGYHISHNSYVKCNDTEKISAIFSRLRNDNKYWTNCGDEFPITAIRDMTLGFDSSQPNHRALLPKTPNIQMITYTFSNGAIATLRTSGTEPKIKYYVEMFGVSERSQMDISEELQALVRAIVDKMLQPTENGLERHCI